MKHSATRELFAYWNDLRGERAAPERGEINPTAIRDILADTFMLDVDIDQQFPFRLAGTRVSGMFDAEQKGRAFIELWRREERRNVAAILLTVADGACPIVAGSVATSGRHDECAIELLLLPLRHRGRTHSRILGLMKITTKPAWFGLLPLGPMSLRALRIIDEEEREWHRPKADASPESSLTPATLPSAADGDSGAPHLRVIQGGLL